MRIGLDMHVVDGLFQGSRTHVIELFSRVASLCPDFEFVALLGAVDRLKTDYPAFSLPNVRVEKLAVTGPVRRLMWELPRLQRKLKLDLLHLQYILPLPSLSPTVVTIHDVLFESHPEYFTPVFRWRSRLLMRLAAKQARHVFTVSAFSKKEICTRFGLDPGQVTITPNSADAKRFFPGKDGDEIVAKRGLTSGNFFLSVGRLEPRKNHVTLLKAYVRLGANAPKLVVVGQKDFGFEAMLAEIAGSQAKHRIMVLEDVSDAELPSLYRHCLAFVYPSLAEGFGMPPLEAMASGVPVIAADNTSLTEVVDKAGILVASQDVAALSKAMQDVAQDPVLRMRLVAAGLEQTQSFSWDRSAATVAARYRQIESTQRGGT